MDGFAKENNTNLLAEKFESFLNENGMSFYKGNEGTTFLLPYKSIHMAEKTSVRLMIRVFLFEESNIMKIGFVARLSEEKKKILPMS